MNSKNKEKIKKKINEWIKNQETRKLCKALFNVEPCPGQREIIDAIVWDNDKRITITAYTQYGKTYAVALATALYLYLHRDKSINEIAPVRRQSKKYRQYLVEFILNCGPLRQQLDVNAEGAEKIKKEVSKQRMTFKDGNEVNILTAGGKNTAQSLMGHGGDLIILDESCDVPDEVYSKRIPRMLGAHPDAVLVEIGNPWRKDNHFYEHWNSEKYRSIKIDWKQGVKEGRITKEFIEEQREGSDLTDTEFKVLYEAEFPDQLEDGLIKHSWVQRAIDKPPFEFSQDSKIVGIDVAELGQDKSVATITYQENGKVNVDTIEYWSKQETMATVNKIDNKLHGHEYLVVDAIGVGSGVASRFKELNYNTYAMKVGESPNKQKSRYSNKKAQYYWKLRDLFEAGEIRINSNHADKLKSELTAIQYEHQPNGAIKIIDPDKSPDFADSLMLACSKSKRATGSRTVSI